MCCNFEGAQHLQVATDARYGSRIHSRRPLKELCSKSIEQCCVAHNGVGAPTDVKILGVVIII